MASYQQNPNGVSNDPMGEPQGTLLREESSTEVGAQDKVEQTFSQGAVTPTEQVLTDIWRDVLENSSFGVNDDFFELGGDSVMAMRVRSRIHALLAADLSLSELFDHSTIARLALLIDLARSSKGGTSSADPGN